MTIGIPFGNYRLIRRLAVGGMAEVFLALQQGPSGFARLTAIKRILPQLADEPRFVEMFLEEARLAAQLTHPNIGHVYECGRVEGSYFIALELLDGVDVSLLIQDAPSQPLPFEHAARIIADVCAGLHYAHTLTGPAGQPLRLVHRDVSPHNIMVTFAGAVKVVDFGIARAAIHISHTLPGLVRGKSTHMSPEQVRGLPLDGRSDLFCAGIVLHELCTGQPLFDRRDPTAAMLQIRDGELPRPRRAGGPIPQELEAVIRRSLAREREDRYADAAEMQLDLEAYLRTSSQMSNSVVLSEWITRHYRHLRPAPDLAAATLEPETAELPAGDERTRSSVQDLQTTVELPRAAARASATSVGALADLELEADTTGTALEAQTAALPRPAVSSSVASADRTTLVSGPPPTFSTHAAPARRARKLAALLIASATVTASVLVGYWVSEPSPPAPPPPSGGTPSLSRPAQARAPSQDLRARLSRAQPDASILASSDGPGQGQAEPTASHGAPVEKPPALGVQPGKMPRTEGPRSATLVRPPAQRSFARAARNATLRRFNAVGYLSITTLPWSTVFCDDKKLGVTPLFRLELPAGEHRLRLVNERGKAVSRRIFIRAGQVTKLSVSLPSS